MIEIEAFLDLHTHTRYPDNNNFPSEDIEFAAKNGGFSEILAMPNSEMVIDSIENLNKAREIDKNLKRWKSIIPYSIVCFLIIYLPLFILKQNYFGNILAPFFDSFIGKNKHREN